MKKITCAMLMIAGMGASAAASAAVPFESGHKVTAGLGMECELLSEAVTLNLSKNMKAAFNCDVVNTDIRIMSCHEAGSNKTTTIDCAVVGFMADGTTPIWNNGTNACTAPWEITNYRIFGGSSRGGTVAAQMNTGSCLTALPEGHSYFTQY